MTDELMSLTAEKLKTLIGQPFEITDEAQKKTEIVLTKVYEKELKGVKGESFTAVFQYPDESDIKDACYLFENKEIGSCSLFLSLNSATECEVVVTRLDEAFTPPKSDSENANAQS